MKRILKIFFKMLDSPHKRGRSTFGKQISQTLNQTCNGGTNPFIERARVAKLVRLSMNLRNPQKLSMNA